MVGVHRAGQPPSRVNGYQARVGGGHRLRFAAAISCCESPPRIAPPPGTSSSRPIIEVVASGSEETGVDGWMQEFNAWAWTPPRGSSRLRGAYNASLRVYSGGFTVRSRFKGGFTPHSRLEWVFLTGLRGALTPQEVHYRWPVVVIQTLRPFGGASVLFAMSGELASCTVWWNQGPRLRAALNLAGLTIIEDGRWGWEAPHRVRRETLGAHAGDVPDAIIDAR